MALTKIDDRGITYPLDLIDNEKIRLGTGNDLSLYHTGSHSVIEDSGTGNLYVLTNSFRLKNAADSETLINAHENSSVELYYDNSKKLETTSTGIAVTGNVVPSGYISMVDNAILYIGTSNDLQIYHDGTDNYWQTGATTTHFRINSGNRLTLKSNGNVQMQGSSGKNLEWVTASGLLTFTDNAKATFGTGNDLELFHDASDSYIKDTGTGSLYITGSEVKITNAAVDENIAKFIQNASVELYYDNSLQFKTTANGCQIDGDLYFDNEVNAGRDLFWDQSADYLKFSDNVQAVFGNGTDLQIFHNGSKSYIKDTGTGSLRINSDDFRVYNAADDEYMLKATENGAVELYYDNSKKIETASYGIYVSGIAKADNFGVNDSGKYKAGASDDLQIYHNGTSSFIDNNNGSLYIRNNVDDWGADHIFIEAKSGDSSIKCLGEADVELYYDGSKKLETFSGGVSVTGSVNADQLHLGDNDKALFGDSNDLQIYADGSNSYIAHNGDGNLRIFSGGAESIRCTEAGATHLFHNGTEVCYTHSAGLKLNDSKKIYFGTGNDLKIYHDGTSAYIKSETTGHFNIDVQYDLYIRKQDGSEARAKFHNDGSVELYYDNSKKFETTSTGITVTGKINPTGNIHMPDNVGIKLGASDDFVLWHYNSDNKNYISSDLGRTIRVHSSSNDETLAQFIPDGAVELYYNNVLKLNTESGGVRVSGQLILPNTSGVSLTIKDGAKAAFGTGDDLQIWHDGSHGYLKNTTNYQYYQATQHHFLNAAGSEIQAKFGENGAVELYYDNVKRFETTSNGAEVGGSLYLSASSNMHYSDTNKAVFGDGGDLAIYHDPQYGHSWIKESGSGGLSIATNQLEIYDATPSEKLLTATANGAVELYHDNSKRFYTTTDGVRILPAGSSATINFNTAASGDVFQFKANKDGTDDTSIAFNVQATGGSSVERARVTENGLTFNGDTSSANALSDYEQGTWSPTMTGATIATQQCAKYTKIGNVVYIQMYITLSSGSGSSALYIGGLPFTVSSDSNYSSFASGRIGAGTYNNATNDIVFQFSGASTTVTPRVADGNINEGMASGQHVMFAGFYHV